MGENDGEGRQQGGGRREEKVGNKKQNEKNQLRAEGSVNVRGGDQNKVMCLYLKNKSIYLVCN